MRPWIDIRATDPQTTTTIHGPCNCGHVLAASPPGSLTHSASRLALTTTARSTPLLVVIKVPLDLWCAGKHLSGAGVRVVRANVRLARQHAARTICLWLMAYLDHEDFAQWRVGDIVKANAVPVGMV
jgi:hypothetical protein